MHEYDVALKNVLRRSSGKLLAELTGLDVRCWHNCELAAVQLRVADLLGESSEGRFLHIELQSTNDPEMAVRMLECATAVKRRFGRFPAQVLLYVGMAPLRMMSTIQEEGVMVQFRMLDIRELDSARLLASDCLEDNVLAVLAKADDAGSTIRRILERIASSDPAGREIALAEFLILARLRKLGPLVKSEVKNMPILDDIWDHDIIGPERVRGEKMLVLRQMEKRFGILDERARERVESMDRAAVEDLGLRLLDATNLRELLN